MNSLCLRGYYHPFPSHSKYHKLRNLGIWPPNDNRSTFHMPSLALQWLLKKNISYNSTASVLAASFAGYPTQFPKLIYLEYTCARLSYLPQSLRFLLTYEIISLSFEELYNMSFFYFSSLISQSLHLHPSQATLFNFPNIH